MLHCRQQTTKQQQQQKLNCNQQPAKEIPHSYALPSNKKDKNNQNEEQVNHLLLLFLSLLGWLVGLTEDQSTTSSLTEEKKRGNILAENFHTGKKRKKLDVYYYSVMYSGPKTSNEKEAMLYVKKSNS